ncbi:MAG TPA: ABC transporter permease, partial [Chthoniobacterales bacterium]|nr:ABC transporter permease [Chthoniobacterales bacterium]
VVNAVLLKPLPFPQPNQLVAVGAVDPRNPHAPGGLDSLSFPDFADFRAQNKSFASLAIYRNATFALAVSGEAQSLRGQRVSAEFFDVLGVKPQIGRTFRREEEAAGGGPNGLTVVLSYAFWQSQFKGADNALGGVILLDGEPHLVVGVMPRGFQFPIESDTVDVYTTTSALATSTDGGKPQTEQRGNHSLQGIGRLKPGVAVSQAQAELRTIAAALQRQYPDSNTNSGVGVLPLRQDLVGDVSGALYVLFGAVVCVLLIASANVANLLLARATVRAKEMALRSALGASRARIIRQLLVESLVLSALGGLIGLLFAAWGTDILVSLVPSSIPRASEIRLDGMVLVFTLLVSLLTGVLFGLAPAFQASRLDLQTALNASGRGAGGGATHNRLRSALVVAEVALALILLTGAGLLLQSFARLSRVNPGLQPERLFTAYVALPSAAYPRADDIKRFFDQVLPEVKSLPGVQAVSTIFPMPLSGSNVSTSFDIEERPLPEGQRADSATRIAGPDYFSTVGVPVLRGRVFDARDQRKSKQVIVVNQRFADKFFPGEEVIGKRITPGWAVDPGDPLPREIVGVVGNVKHHSLRDDATPEMYMPATQMPMDVAYLLVRTATADPASFTTAVRGGIARIDAGIPLTRVKVFDDYLARSLARPRFNALLLGIFAGVALLLTAIGIYGVMAYSVAQRRQEIGIRMALGAQRGDVLRLVVGNGMKLTGVGVILGLGAALALARLLKTLLYGVTAFDAPTLGAVSFLLCLIALLACWFPARRAAGVNPIVALREG